VIEHPNRQFQQSTQRAVVKTAAGHIARLLLDYFMNANDASCPWMPRIKDLTLLGPMGVRRPHSSLDGITPDQAYFTPLSLRLAA
jgi:hypothetical protein